MALFPQSSYSIKVKTILMTLTIFIVSLWVALFFVSQSLRKNMESMIGDQQIAAATMVSDQINQELQTRLRELESFANDNSGAIDNKNIVQMNLHRRIMLREKFNGGVSVFNAKSEIVVSEGSRRNGSEIESDFSAEGREDIAKAIASGKPEIKLVSASKSGGLPLLSFILPMRGLNGSNATGAVEGIVNLDRSGLLNAVTVNRFGKTGTYTLFDPKARVVVAATDGRINTGVGQKINLLLKKQGVEPNEIVVGIQNDLLSSSKIVPVSGWYVTASLPIEEAFRPIRDMQYQTLAATLFLTIVAGMYMQWLLRRQFAPIFSAAETLSKMASSDMPLQPLPVLQNDETGLLLNSFNHLLSEISDREVARNDSEDRLRMALDAALIGDWDLDLVTNVSQRSKRHGEIFGQDLPLPDWCIDDFLQRVHPEDVVRVSNSIQSCLLDGLFWRDEFRIVKIGGEVAWILSRMQVFHDANGKPLRVHSMVSDITERKTHEEKLLFCAHYDALTGLPNRILLADRLQQAMARSKRQDRLLVVAYLDLDGFKTINDLHGHKVGDQLLITLSARMKDALRSDDTLARLGGDEFVIVLQDLSQVSESDALIERLLHAAASPVNIGELTVQVSASLGATVYPQDSEVDADLLLRQADHAMYQAKTDGKNRFQLFDADQDRIIRTRHEFLEEIKHGLTNNQFVLYYQPKVNMRTGDVFGVEALIRWNHPDKGFLLPGAFLPAIENNDFSITLGDWVMETALTQLERWNATGLSLSVSVNVGARQLQHPYFVTKLKELLANHASVNPSDLVIELLESSALDDLGHVSTVMADCSKTGVRFALDDFGTGYSSLTYLKRLSASQIKIDQSFIRDMLHDPDDLAILQGILSLASAFRCEVIAEGVESIEHGRLLLQIGCTQAQGYGIAYPMPAIHIPMWRDEWRPDLSWDVSQQVSPMDTPLLFAKSEHCAWVASVENFLRGETFAVPILSYQLCRFGQWLDGYGMTQYSNESAFQTVSTLHKESYLLAAQLCALKQAGVLANRDARVTNLFRLMDDFVLHLNGFVQDVLLFPASEKPFARPPLRLQETTHSAKIQAAA